MHTIKLALTLPRRILHLRGPHKEFPIDSIKVQLIDEVPDVFVEDDGDVGESTAIRRGCVCVNGELWSE